MSSKKRSKSAKKQSVAEGDAKFDSGDGAELGQSGAEESLSGEGAIVEDAEVVNVAEPIESSESEPTLGSSSTHNAEQSSHSETPKTKTISTSESFAKLPAWSELLIILGFFLVANDLSSTVMGAVHEGGSASKDFAMFLSYTISFGLTIIFAVILRLYSGFKRPILRLGLRRTNPSIILWGVVLLMVMNVCLEPLVDIFPSKYLDLLKEALGDGGGWMVMTAVVAAPILEELLFRGVIQEGISRRYGATWGILISALIFGMIHVIPQQVVTAFFAGIVLGYIYFRTKSILPVIIIHAVNNGIAFIIMKVNGGKYADATMRETINNDVIYWIIYTICSLIVIVAGIAIWQAIDRDRRERKERKKV